MMGQAASRGQDLEIADALKLLEQLDLAGKLERGDVMSEPVTAAGVERGGDYISPAKDNRKALHENIERVFDGPASRHPAPKKRTGASNSAASK